MGAPRENSSCQRNRMYSRKSHRDRYELVTLLYANESAIIRPIYMHIDVGGGLFATCTFLTRGDQTILCREYDIHQWFMSHNGIGVSTVPRGFASRPISLEVRAQEMKKETVSISGNISEKGHVTDVRTQFPREWIRKITCIRYSRQRNDIQEKPSGISCSDFLSKITGDKRFRDTLIIQSCFESGTARIGESWGN